MDTQQNGSNETADKVVGELQKDFKIVGSHRVHSWYAWAIVGIVFGMALGIVYIANRSGQVENSDASTVKSCPFSLNIKIYAEEYSHIIISNADWSLAEKYKTGIDTSVKAKKASEKVEDAKFVADRGALGKCKGAFDRKAMDAKRNGGANCDVGSAQNRCQLDIVVPDLKADCKLSKFTPVGSPSVGYDAKNGKYTAFAQSSTAYVGVNCRANFISDPKPIPVAPNNANQPGEPINTTQNGETPEGRELPVLPVPEIQTEAPKAPILDNKY